MTGKFKDDIFDYLKIDFERPNHVYDIVLILRL